jgi:2-C-methyl-D-erythritol 4-phosphate cytidylyltransferase
MNVKQVQTPQVFDIDLIKNAYKQVFDPSFTDDATVLEKTGEKIHMVDGNRENIKITNPEDLIIVQTLLSFIS